MTLTETIVLNLRHAIVQGEYKPGEHLTEDALCSRFGASRTPIREALKRLEAEGLVKITPNAGAKVIKLTHKDVSHIYDILIILEATAARLACSQISDGQLSKLEEYEFTLERAAAQGNFDLVFELNLQFHWLITEATGNPYLIEIRKNFRALVDRFARYAPFIPDQLQATLQEHPRIIDAIKRHNPALAEFQAKEHMENAKKFMIGYFEKLEGAD